MTTRRATTVDHVGVPPQARLTTSQAAFTFAGRWVTGSPWGRFGRYDSYVVLRHDGAVLQCPAHAGDLVPGSTEDLTYALKLVDPRTRTLPVPMTVELDPTNRCASKDCGTRCFSAPYRALGPDATIATPVIAAALERFATAGGRIVRFDGGGDPLLHSDVRNGYLPLLARQLGLRSTILTSGDLLPAAQRDAFVAAECYVRVSVNAARNETRAIFHGNQVDLDSIFEAMRDLVRRTDIAGSVVPVGATFLLDPSNFLEVFDCARRCRDIGVAHFSVRRVLGPASLRPVFPPDAGPRIDAQFELVRGLEDERFVAFLPWRPIDEADVNPAAGGFSAERCWQSTFKVVLEPDLQSTGLVGQLCGRYRGGGLGQVMQLPALLRSANGTKWVDAWRAGFDSYPVARAELPRRCVSCIDRGFIALVDRLVKFLDLPARDFEIFHLRATGSPAVREWEANGRELPRENPPISH